MAYLFVPSHNLRASSTSSDQVTVGTNRTPRRGQVKGLMLTERGLDDPAAGGDR